MLIRHPDGRIYFCGSGGATHLASMKTVNALVAKGVPYVDVPVAADADRIIGDADRLRRIEWMLVALQQIEAREEQRDLANDPPTV